MAFPNHLHASFISVPFNLKHTINYSITLLLSRESFIYPILLEILLLYNCEKINRSYERIWVSITIQAFIHTEPRIESSLNKLIYLHNSMHNKHSLYFLYKKKLKKWKHLYKLTIQVHNSICLIVFLTFSLIFFSIQSLLHLPFWKKSTEEWRSVTLFR